MSERWILGLCLAALLLCGCRQKQGDIRTIYIVDITDQSVRMKADGLVISQSAVSIQYYDSRGRLHDVQLKPGQQIQTEAIR